jgi:clathrin heavy chain
MQLYNFEKKQQ